ncbi:MAG: hypothetical protein ABIH00_04240 [Armatimonadota bacterium]
MSFSNIINFRKENIRISSGSAAEFKWELINKKDVKKIISEFIDTFLVKADNVVVISKTNLTECADTLLASYKTKLPDEFRVMKVVFSENNGRDLIAESYIKHFHKDDCGRLIKKDFLHTIKPWLNKYSDIREALKSPELVADLIKAEASVGVKAANPSVRAVNDILSTIVNDLTHPPKGNKSAELFAEGRVDLLKSIVGRDERFADFINQNPLARKEFDTACGKAFEYFKAYYNSVKLKVGVNCDIKGKKEAVNAMHARFRELSEILKRKSPNLLRYFENKYAEAMTPGETLRRFRSSIRHRMPKPPGFDVPQGRVNPPRIKGVPKIEVKPRAIEVRPVKVKFKY